MAQLFVPINDKIEATDSYKLFEVVLTGYGSTTFNGLPLQPQRQKLQSYFGIYQCFSFGILRKVGEKEELFRNFNEKSERINSISLGVLCSAYAASKNRELNQKYDSITVTGNYEVQDGKIILKGVADIEKKYEAVQEYTKTNTDKNHLFVCVSDNDKNNIISGWHNNIFVMRISPNEKIECVFAEIFDLSDVQKQKLGSLPQTKNEYIESVPFIKWKKELLEPERGGFILYGASNCGKSIAAANFCKYMISTSTVDELVWITIVDNENFFKELRKSISFDIKKYFSDQFNQLDKLLENKKKTCLIIDNIECDLLEDILFSIKRNYKNFVDINLLKIVITSWKNCEDRTLLSDLKLIEKNCEKLIGHEDFKYIVYSTFKKMGIEPHGLKGFKENQKKLFELLSELCFDGERAFPGRVSKSIASISEIGIDAYIERYSQEKLKAVSKKMQQVRIDFEILDSIPQWVLLAFLGINKFRKKLNIQQICEKISVELLKMKPENAFISEKKIRDAVRTLLRKDWIHESKNKTDIFYVKTDIINYCVFSDYEKGEVDKELSFARDVLIPLNIKIKHAIQNDQFEIFEKLIKNFSDRKEINEFFICCIEYDRGINYLKILVEKGIDPEYLDDDGDSAIDVIWCRDTDMEVLDYLLKNGFKPRKKIPIPIERREDLGFGDYVSPLVLASDMGHIQRFKYILSHNLYDDINAYEFKGHFTILQFITTFGESVEIVDLLIKANADIKLKTSKGWSLLTCAVINKDHPEILEYILDNNLYENLTEKDKNGKTSLDYAKKINNQKAIELLSQKAQCLGISFE